MANKKKVLIKYTSRDFSSIKEDLLEYARRYYPESQKDFNEGSFGSLTFDQVSYIGDILSFYLDYSANESFLDTAIEYDNILKHGKAAGYKFRSNPSSYGIGTFYIVVPAKANGLGPDPVYIPILQKGSEFSSVAGNGFILNENVDFSDANNEVVVAAVNETTGVPTSYAIKANGQIVSGELVEEIIDVNEYEQFLRIELDGDNITEIISVADAEGHEYYEVDYLSQNVVYKSILNRDADKNLVTEVLKPVVVPRRFILEQDRNTTYLQFGYGSTDEISVSSIADPSDVVLRVHGRTHVTDTSFDPAKLNATDKFGVVPSNTQMSVVYRRNTADNVNAATDTVTQVVSPLIEFDDIVNLNSTQVNSVVESLEVTNESPIVGDVSLPSSSEIKRRIYDTFPTQNRAVTPTDYVSMIYMMPPQFGSVKRAKIIQDRDSFKRNLNLYVVSEDQTGVLTAATETLKKNIKTWITRSKMANDTIDIFDAKIVNFGVEFEAIAVSDENKFSVLSAVTENLKDFFQNPLDISEPINIMDIYSEIRNTEGVLDVVRVKIVAKAGGQYSDTTFDFDEAKSSDGRMILCPDNCVFEIKYPLADTKGTIR